jgi:sulfur-oxidizing protein SoxZ
VSTVPFEQDKELTGENPMSNPMRVVAAERGGVIDVKVLMFHVMETGQRKDTAGVVIPAHFIQTVSVECGGRKVMQAQWGTAMSRDPFCNFRFKGARKGDKVVVTWTDNKGDSRTDEGVIA